MKNPGLDMAARPGLIYSGFGVRAPSQTHTLKLYWPEHVHYSRPHGVNCPHHTIPVKSFGPIVCRVLVPKPFVGRTRLGVNQGDEKCHKDLDHEWDQYSRVRSSPNGIRRSGNKGGRVPAYQSGKGLQLCLLLMGMRNEPKR
jgi:hypothetical protein